MAKNKKKNRKHKDDKKSPTKFQTQKNSQKPKFFCKNNYLFLDYILYTTKKKVNKSGLNVSKFFYIQYIV
jgi:hypothetical protein